ncbi:MAG: hypothetical protein AB1428_12945 [Bacteroidota bacterium]
MSASELVALVTAVKGAVDFAKGLKAVMDKAKLDDELSELFSRLLSVQSFALTLQSEHQTLIEEKGELSKKLMEFENWKKTEADYALTEICPKIFIYVYKKSAESVEPVHWLCPNCWQAKQKSILQGKHDRVYACPRCNFTMANTNEPPPPPLRMRTSYR